MTDLLARGGLPQEVLIVGSGLIGTSLGLALRGLGVDVVLADTDPVALSGSIGRGAGRAASTTDVPDLVVVAVPPGAVAAVAVAALDRHPQATVMDVASSKAGIVAAVGERTTAASRFVGTHPMAGREIPGPAGADADLFEDRPWVITPTSSTAAGSVAVAEAVAAACGAIVVQLPAEVHDRAVALTSHAPQLVASTLAAQLAIAPDGDIAISGQGLRDTTRIADSDPRLWTDILASNAAEVAPIVEAVVTDLRAAAAALRAEAQRAAALPGTGSDGVPPNLGGVAELLRRGKAGRDRLPAKHGGAARAYSVVGVVLADKPGQLGRLFAAAGAAGINLEDVHIEHSVGRLNALVELSVLPENHDALVDALRAGGWRVRAQ